MKINVLFAFQLVNLSGLIELVMDPPFTNDCIHYLVEYSMSLLLYESVEAFCARELGPASPGGPRAQKCFDRLGKGQIH